MYIADLHIHSRYSMASSRECAPEYLDLWARRKGIGLIGTGDFTHPAWREELREKLEPTGDGLYRLKKEFIRQEEGVAGESVPPRFVVSGEINTVYKKYGKTRKVHSLILLPGLDAAERVSACLGSFGRLEADGRPALKLDCRELLGLVLELCPEAMYIPAHIWTPHYSIFGAFSAFHSIEECYEDLAPYVRALETGLSSDPAMNWRVSTLDGYQLISNSDAHSPSRLGREANLLAGEPSYEGLQRAVMEGEGLLGTLEFFPEEGKYHLDGHRKCGLCLTPEEAEEYQGLCPICGKKLTLGVVHRIGQMADRPQGYAKPNGIPYESLMPLEEVIAAAAERTTACKGVQRQYQDMLKVLGPELGILRNIPLEDIQKAAGSRVAEGIRRLRAGQAERISGYDGAYGKIKLF